MRTGGVVIFPFEGESTGRLAHDSGAEEMPKQKSRVVPASQGASILCNSHLVSLISSGLYECEY